MIPLWLYWARIALAHANLANEASATDEGLDVTSANLQANLKEKKPAADHVDLLPIRIVPKIPTSYEEEEQILRENIGKEILTAAASVEDGNSSKTDDEMLYSMISVSSAAHALDGFYGSVEPLVRRSSRSSAKRPTKRSRKILETLKLGFNVGRYGQRWVAEIDWLFETRNRAVHHAEDPRPLIVTRVTDNTTLYSGSESFEFSAPSAFRATGLALNIMYVCLQNAKPTTADWAHDRLEVFNRTFNREDTEG